MTDRGPFFYDTNLNWTGARKGVLAGPGLPQVEIGAPPEFGGEPHRWTPEHFYVAAAEACLLTTFLAIADISKLRVLGYRSSAKGKMEWVEGAGFRMTEIELAPEIEVESEAARERALRLIEKAEKNCLVARSITARVSLQPVVRAGLSAPAA